MRSTCVRRSPWRRVAQALRAAESERVCRCPRRASGPAAGAALHSAAGVGERDQVAGEIAAVDRRDVVRLERPQVARVVPVVEVAAEARAASSIVASVASSRSTVSMRPGPAEVARGHRGQQVEADVGRRGAVGDDRLRVLLEVVGRQHVVGGRHEGLEEAPGAARDQPQRARVGSARRGTRRRDARRQARSSARSPATRARASSERQRHGQDVGASAARRPAATTAPSDDAARHVAGRTRRRSRRRLTVACAAVTHSSRCRRRDEQARRACARSASAISQAWCGEERDRASAVCDAREAQVARASARRWLRSVMPRAPRHDRGEHGKQRRQRDRRDDEARSRRARPCSGSIQPATSARQARPAPSSERRRLSSIFQRPIAPARRAAAEEPGQQLPVAARPAVLARRGDVVARRELLDHLDVGGEAGAREDRLRRGRG